MQMVGQAPLHAAVGGEGKEVWFAQNRMRIKATAEQTGGAFGLVESWVAAGASPPLHVHHREDESFWVLEGRVTFQCGDERITGGAGTFVFLPRGVPHTFVVEGEEDARLLTLLTPGGGEGFFVDGGREPEGPGLPPPGPPDIARYRELGPIYGNDVLGPPIAPTEV
jgi:quercetin dioxygenase-like cupin family protein